MSYNVSPPPPGIPGLSSSTNDAVVRWDGTAGAAVQDSVVTMSDAGDIRTPGAVQFLSDDMTPHYCELLAAQNMAVNVTIRLPVSLGSSGQSLLLGGDGFTLAWFTPFSSLDFNAYKQASPIKSSAQCASTANIDMGAGNPGVVDGVNLAFGGSILLKNQTDPTENGLWNVDVGGVWTRDSTMPDNAGSTYSAIVPVNDGGAVNGNTIWYSRSNGDGNVPFSQLPTAATPTRLVSLTTTARDALSGVVDGMIIYNTSTNKFQGRAGGAWADLN